MKNENTIKFPKIVDQVEWQKAHDALLLKEKAATKARDALAAERRRLPMVQIEKQYAFTGPKGKMSLLDLFEGRRQLILYHFMFAPSVSGWPDAGCVGCSMVTDQFGHPAHLHARDISFCLASVAPLKNIEKYKKRMGWTLPWYSSDDTDFNKDFGRTTDKGENFGLSVFIHDDSNNIYRTYFTDGRGTEGLTSPEHSSTSDTPSAGRKIGKTRPPAARAASPSSGGARHDEYGKKDFKGPQG